MIKPLHINNWKAIFYLAVLLCQVHVYSQCGLTITNPPCSATIVDITAPSITAGSASIGTLSYWSNPQATVPLANPNAINASGFYYIKNTVGSCSSVSEVTVTIGTTAPTGSTQLMVNCPLSSATSIFFDFNSVGQTAFNYTYQIDGGPIVSGTKMAPTSHIVTGLTVGQQVVFTVSFVGVCTPPKKTTGYVIGSPPGFAGTMNMCIGATLPTVSPNGIEGYWVPSGPVASGTNNYTFVGTPCSAQQVVAVTGIPTATPTFNPIGPLCQNAAPPALPASSTNGISGTWSPANINTSATGTQNFTFTPNPGQCATIKVVSVTINSQPTPTFAAYPATLCQNATAPALPSSTNGMSGTWNPATINTTTTGLKSSVFTPTPGQCAASTPVTINVNVVPNVNPTFNPIGPICAGTPAPALPATSIEGFAGTWNPPVINTATAGTQNYTFTPSASTCATPGSLSITITPAPATTFNNFTGNALTFCPGSVAPSLPAVSSNGVAGTWSPATINNTANGTYVFTPTAGCASTYTLNVTVTPTSQIQFASLPPVFSLCVGSPSIPLATTSDNGITGTWTAASIDTSTPGVKHYSFMANPGQCVTSQIYSINVDVTPKTIPLYGPIMPICEGTAPSQGLALPTTVNGIVGTWSPSTSIDNTIIGLTIYTFTPTANQCADPTTLNIVVIARDIPDFTLQPIASFCAGTTPVPVLPSVSDNGITGTWSPGVIDNTVTTTYTFTPDTGLCAAQVTMTVIVDQPIDPGFDDIVLCAGTTPPILESISPSGVSGSWTPAVIDPAANGATYTFTPDAGECALSDTIAVTILPVTLQSVGWTATSFFSADAVVTVTADAPGNYLYQLDNGPLYTTNVFTNVAPGTHTVTVYDVNGCTPPISLVDAITIVDYPRFFTPNLDGYNDTWNIWSLRGVGQEQATIFIFDRHGKLLKQIAPAGTGWDGTYNNQPLPSSDYWFVVKYGELGVPREFKAHFSLKR